MSHGGPDRRVVRLDEIVGGAGRLTAEQRVRFTGYLKEIFEAVGLDTSGSARHTPRHHLDALVAATAGNVPSRVQESAWRADETAGDCEEAQTVVAALPFAALCEQHAFPFFGRVWIGYLAAERPLGHAMSAEIVTRLSRRFTSQKRLGEQLAQAIERRAAPHGVAVRIEAVHLCTSVLQAGGDVAATTHSVTWRGAHVTRAELRSEFLELCSSSH